MRKLMTILSVLFVASFILASCGATPESEAKKMAKMWCEMQELTEKYYSGDETVEPQLENLSERMENLGKQLEEKWGEDLEAQEDFQKAFEKALDDC